MKKSLKYNFGFTLIELLVVVSIISLLSSVIFASLSSARLKARDSVRISQIGEVKTALELYYSNHGNYPDNLNPLFPNTIPGNWLHVMSLLSDEGLIHATFSRVNTENGPYFSFIPVAYAMGGGSYYFCSIQDPLYKTADDYLYSYGYVASPDLQSYKIRVYLEDPNNSALNSSPPYGTFLDTEVIGITACDRGLHYYCTSNKYIEPVIPM